MVAIRVAAPEDHTVLAAVINERLDNRPLPDEITFRGPLATAVAHP